MERLKSYGSLKDETFNQYVLTIEDACKNEDKIPEKVVI